ncbi:DUF1488 family protein [Paraburkholderia fungorum]|uniref:DUF1488 family protein n=1 Tax=Paraburkholderia fungorum TaxID=134537 RepID=UPI0038BA4CBD
MSVVEIYEQTSRKKRLFLLTKTLATSVHLFSVSLHERTMECAITKESLTQFFWAPAGASDTRLLKAFADGSKRITAVAERKMLTATQEPVVLAAVDFANKGARLA